MFSKVCIFILLMLPTLGMAQGQSFMMRMMQENVSGVDYTFGGNLKAEYLFDTDTSDSSGFAPDGTLLSGATVSGGLLDTTTGYMFVNSFTNLTSYPFTICGWVKRTGGINGSCFGFAVSTTFNVFYHVQHDGTQWKLENRNGGTPVSKFGGTATSGTWYFLSVVYNSDTSKTLYVDGAPVITETTSITFNSSVDRIAIGIIGDSSPSSQLAAKFDAIRVYDISLTTDQMDVLIAESGQGGNP